MRTKSLKSLSWQTVNGRQQWLCWNDIDGQWEIKIEPRWYECGEPIGYLAQVYARICTKYIGHEGEHGSCND